MRIQILPQQLNPNATSHPVKWGEKMTRNPRVRHRRPSTEMTPGGAADGWRGAHLAVTSVTCHHHGPCGMGRGQLHPGWMACTGQRGATLPEALPACSPRHTGLSLPQAGVVLGPWEALGSEGECGCCPQPRSCHRATQHRLGEVGSFLLQGRRGQPREVSTLPKVTQLSSHRAKIRTQGRWTLRPTLLPVNPFLNYIFLKNHTIWFLKYSFGKKK